MKRFVGPETKLINLQGKTLMPGFIDPHSHFSITAVRYSQGFDISPPPFGTVTSIPQLLSNIRDYITSNNIQSGVAISAGGYNDI
jgi:predicted amidohydrolase YtcJ